MRLAAPLQELRDHDVLERRPPGARTPAIFRHQLLRDALYLTVPAADLRRFHARAAEFGQGSRGRLRGPRVRPLRAAAGMRTEAFHSALAGARSARAASTPTERPSTSTAARSANAARRASGPRSSRPSTRGTARPPSRSTTWPVIEETATLARRHFLDAGRPLDAANMLVRPRARTPGATCVPRLSVDDCSPRRTRSLPRCPRSPEGNLVLSDVRDDAGHARARRRPARGGALTLFERGARPAPARPTDPDTGDIDYAVASVTVLHGEGPRGFDTMLRGCTPGT